MSAAPRRVPGPAIAALALVVVTAGCLGLGPLPGADGRPDVLLATTTSTQDSGLLDILVPAFEASPTAGGADLGVLAVGSGQALAMGRRGDADVLLVHSPAAEEAFMAAGHGLSRTYVFHNRFLLVGPPDDPAGVATGATATNVSRALAAVHANGTEDRAAFASRGDDSGTHAKERALWTAAGLDPTAFDADWYHALGQGMGPTLRAAAEMEAYTLTDEATYLEQAKAAGLPLEVHVAEDAEGRLHNPYHVLVVHPDGRAFADWLTGDEARDLVEGFRIDGRQVFFLPGEGPPP